MLLAMLWQLVELLSLVCSIPYEAGMYRAVFVIACFGVFWVGEPVLGSRMDTSSRALCIEDLWWSGSSFKITIWFSKTDQTEEGQDYY